MTNRIPIRSRQRRFRTRDAFSQDIEDYKDRWQGNTDVFHITRLSRKAGNCCCSTTGERTKFVRNYFTHTRNLITGVAYNQERAPFFAKLSIYFLGPVTPRTSYSRGLICREKKGRRKAEWERKKDRTSAPLAVYNLLSMKALISCLYIFRFYHEMLFGNPQFSPILARHHGVIAGGVSSTAQCFATFNWVAEKCASRQLRVSF